MESELPGNSESEVVAQEAVADVIAPDTQPEAKPVWEAIAVKQPIRLWLIVLLLGWAFDFLFWEQSVGANFALFLALSLLGGLAFLLLEGYKPSWKSLLLLPPFAFFAIVTFLRNEPVTIFLAYSFTLFSIGLFATSYLGGRWYLYRLSNYFGKFFRLIGDLIVRPFEFFRQTQQVSRETGDKKVLPVAGILRGLLIALPIVFCFGTLLASADVVFNQKLTDFFDSEKLGENIERTILVIVFAYLLAGAFLHAVTRSRDVKITPEDKSLIKSFLGFPEAAVVLGSVSLLFLTFVIIQFQYFFGGETNIGVQGFTYSQYARRGFNELVIVAFFSLVLILGLSTITRREDETQKKVYSGLSVAVVGLVMVILVSAYQRISMAIAWHGFSRLRLYPRVFLIWLGILLLVVVILEIFRCERYFAFAVVLACVGFAASLIMVDIDAAIVRHNLQRYLQGKNLNVAHLASLSDDAVPALVEEYFSAPVSKREPIGAILACYRYRASRPHAVEDDWRSFNYSEWRAHQALESISPYLAGYVIKYEHWPRQVRTPTRKLYDCTYIGPAQGE
ncbi:MAG TPA: DUF4173 domain-containing protein [Anaerolineales bacterium]|nr:DUF4173 domain-containing protein [Anaerolineales bacterium]